MKVLRSIRFETFTIRIYPEACPVEEGDDILSHRGTSFNAEHRLYLPMLTDYT